MTSYIEVSLAVVLIATLLAAVTDLWKYRVFNWVTLPLILSGLLFNGVVVHNLDSSVAGCVFGFCALMPLYMIGGMGAGDVKLLAGIGAWLGLQWTFYVFVTSSLAAGVYSILLLVLAGGVNEALFGLRIACVRAVTIGRHLGSENRVETEMRRPDNRTRIIPFAAMIAIGVLATVVLYWRSSLWI